MLNETIIQQLAASGVIAVVTIEDVADAMPAARALLAGGISAIELTLRTPVAIEAIRRIRGELPEILVGAGTVLTGAQMEDAANAGAAFGVAPGCNPRTLRAAQERGFPFAPGVMTPSDVEIAVEHGCRVLKYFPAETAGGLQGLKTMASPFSHLGLRYIPLGGIDATSLASYLGFAAVLCVGGSWLAGSAAVREKDWAGITRRAAEASRVVQRVRGSTDSPSAHPAV